MLVELDIHFRIEDDLYYPALAAASTLIAVAHAEHRQVTDQLAACSYTAERAGYEDEWNIQDRLGGHADEEERDMIPALHPVRSAMHELDALGEKMAARIENYATPRSKS